MLERYRTRLVESLKVIVKTVVLEYLDMGDYSEAEAFGTTSTSSSTTTYSNLSYEVTNKTIGLLIIN